MRNREYKEAKLKIFENHSDGSITESQRDQLLLMLEKKKGEDLTPENIKDFFDKLKDSYPDLEDKIESLQKKIEDTESDDASDDDNEDENISEAALDIMRMIDSIF